MINPLTFDGRMQRLPYALSAMGVFFSQHLVTVLAFKAYGWPLALDWFFFTMPLRTLGSYARAPDGMAMLALAWALMAAWLLAALTFRRAAGADTSRWAAAFAIAPVVQIPAMLWLCLLPTRPEGMAAELGEDNRPDLKAAAQGLVAGVALTLFSVVVGALLFGTYGYGMFVAAPFVIGAITAYLANRGGDVGGGHTAALVTTATLLGGVALILAALEGLFCIVVAAPLAIAVALVGGLLGRAIALRTRSSPRHTLSGVALLPLLFAVENALPVSMPFESLATIEVSAPPDKVWRSLIKMDLSDEPVPLLFQLGLAYALRGEVIGEGVGAARIGEFSTGTARERVVEWIPNRKLAFVVVDDVPAIRELSPYATVHAPHAVGYFRTGTTSFELVPRADGGTQIVERTSHELKLDPVYYWLPLVRWAVETNNARVLAHVKKQAERGVAVAL